jgi:N-acetylglutamate synthase-like GNAT family acetyltransferase
MISVRQAEAKDAFKIQELLYYLTNNSDVCVLPERLDEVASCDYSFVFVAEYLGVVVGTLQLTMCPDVMFRSQPYAVIENIVVNEEHQKLGIGSSLMNSAFDLCVRRSCSKIMISSSVNRLGAHKFFENLGFSSTGKKSFIKYPFRK